MVNRMISFQQLWENMEASRDEPSESKASSVIRTGIGVSEDFWDNFLAVINNSTGLSELLDVPVTKISSWHHRIREELDKVKQADGVPDTSTKKKMLHTGLPQDKEDDVTNLDQGTL